MMELDVCRRRAGSGLVWAPGGCYKPTMREIAVAGILVSECPKPYTPSTKVLCHGCQQEIWFSQLTAQQIREEQGSLDAVKPLCIECTRALPQVELQRPSGATLAELKSRGCTDGFIDRVMEKVLRKKP